MLTLEKHVLESRGARGCSDSWYRAAELTCCGRQIVEDHELGELYFDASDLSKVVTTLHTATTPHATCPVCGAADWKYVLLDDVRDVSAEWRWACRRA